MPDEEKKGEVSGKNIEEFASNPWGIVGSGRIPWWTCLLGAVMCGGIAWAVVAWEGGMKDPRIGRWFAIGVAAVGFVVGLGVWAVDRILFRWGAALRRRRINGRLFSTLFFGAVFLMFYATLIHHEIATGEFRWADDWFGVVLVTVFGALFAGSLAAWRGREWGNALFAGVAALFVGGLGVTAIFTWLDGLPVPGRGTVLALATVWIGGAVLGVVDGLLGRKRGRDRERLPIPVVLAWPVVMVLFAPVLLIPLAAFAAWILGGEWVGSRFGHPYVGAFAALGVALAGVGVAQAISVRKKRRGEG